MHGRSADTSLAKIREMSELFDKQVNAQKEKLPGFKLPQAHEKVCDEIMKMKERKKKRRACKNVIDGRKPFIRRTQGKRFK